MSNRVQPDRDEKVVQPRAFRQASAQEREKRTGEGRRRRGVAGRLETGCSYAVFLVWPSWPDRARVGEEKRLCQHVKLGAGIYVADWELERSCSSPQASPPAVAAQLLPSPRLPRFARGLWRRRCLVPICSRCYKHNQTRLEFGRPSRDGNCHRHQGQVESQTLHFGMLCIDIAYSSVTSHLSCLPGQLQIRRVQLGTLRVDASIYTRSVMRTTPIGSALNVKGGNRFLVLFLYKFSTPPHAAGIVPVPCDSPRQPRQRTCIRLGSLCPWAE